MYDLATYETTMIQENKVAYNDKISVDTLVIMRHYHIEYETKIICDNTIIYAKEDPLRIVQKSCLDNFTSYEGQREAISYHFGYARKIPIPLIFDNIYLFPTTSTQKLDCIWVNYNMLSDWKRKGSRIRLYFKNDTYLDLQESYASIYNQINRTAHIQRTIQQQQEPLFLW